MHLYYLKNKHINKHFYSSKLRKNELMNHLRVISEHILKQLHPKNCISIMERNLTFNSKGSGKRTRQHFSQRLFSLLSLIIFITSLSYANNLFDLQVTSTDVSCPGAMDGTATATPLNGWAPFTYDWSNGESTSTISNLAPGLYEVTVVSSDGAIQIGETYVDEGDGPTLYLSASYETCPGSSDANASVNVSGGTEPYSYLWSTGETFVIASNISAGTYSVTVTDDNGCMAIGSIDVELSPEGVWLMTSSTPSDCGLDNGTAHVSAMSGTPPYVIVWSDGQTGEDAINLAPGTYDVSVTDANGCSNTETVEITSNSDLNLSINGENADCGISNGSATVSVNGGTGPFTYNWSNGGTTATITGLSEGSYSVTVTDATACSNSISIYIDAENGIDVDITKIDADCNSNNGSATASASGGIAPYSYQWSNGSNTATISGLAPGSSYTVTATDSNGCSDTESVMIDGTEADGGIITTVDDLETCSGDGIDDIVNVTLSGNTGDNSQWVITDTNGDIIGLFDTPTFNFEGAGPGICVIWHLSYQDGLIGLMIGNNVTDLQGCYSFSNSISVMRSDPEGGEISTNDDTSICVGDGIGDFIDVSLTGASGTNQGWIITDNTGNILALPAAPPFNFDGAGPGICLIWSISYEPGLMGLSSGSNISGLEGCYELSSNSITVTRTEAPSLSLSATDVSCNGGNDGSISSTVTGGDGTYTYNWSNGATTADINNLEPGTYSLTVTDGNACSAIATATVAQPALLAVIVTGTNETCLDSNDGTASANAIGGTAPYTYLWNNGATTASITGLAPGIYNVIVTDANGCTASSTDVIIASDGLTSCSATVSSSYNEGVDISTFGGSDGMASVEATGGTLPYTFQWSNGQTGADADNLSAGTYSVIVTDANACTCESSVTLTDPSKVGNFVWEDLDKDGIQDAGEPGIASVVVNLTGTSSAGISVFRTEITGPDGTYLIDGLPSGNYKITFDEPTGYNATIQDEGGDDSLDSDMNPGTGMTDYFDLGIAECNITIDAGLFRCVSIGDFVFYDGNHDGIQQPWEPGYADAAVRLMQAGPDGILCTNDDEVLDARITGNDGRYLFECIEPGTYYLQFLVNTNEYMLTGQDLGGDDNLDSDPNPDTGKTDPFTIIENQADDLSFDAGVYLICDDFTSGGQIGYDQDICAGEFPDPLVSISLPAGGYGVAEYLWLQSTTGGPISSWTPIPNSDSPSYAPPQLYQTTYFIRCARRENCDEFVAESNSIVIVVNTCLGGLIQNLNATIEAQAQVSIKWTTNPEDQLYMYYVERSQDGNEFELLGTVNGQGDQQTTNYYSFMDESPRLGRNIYRVIREHLSTNNLIYSDNVEVLFSTLESDFFVYPNPTAGKLYVESFQNMNGNASLELYDATGKLLDKLVVDYTVGSAEFDFGKYSSGVYFIKVIYEGKDDTDFIKIIKE